MAEFINLPPDVQRLITFQLPLSDIYHISLTCRQTHKTLSQKLLWSTLYARDFTAQPIKEDPKLLYQKHTLGIRSYTHPDDQTRYISRLGFEKKIQSRIRDDKSWLEGVMMYASQGGQEHLVNKMLDLGVKDVSCSILFAADKGHLKIINMFLDRGLTSLNHALRYVACGNNEENQKVALKLIDQGATDLDLPIESAKRNRCDKMVAFLENLKAQRH